MKFHRDWILGRDGSEAELFGKIKRQILSSRGQLQIDREKCSYCGMCQKKCHAKAITVNRKTQEWTVNDTQCVRCGHCVRACPNKALTLVKNS